jgi:hypothetical protein
MTFTVKILDRNYTNYEYYNESNEKVELDFNPIKYKLFSGDTFTIIDNKFELCNSKLINNKEIAGVLILKNDKKYGKYKDKYLYKCIPDNKEYPIFLIPYSGNSLINVYVIFEFKNWDDKHPIGLLTNNFGSDYYEYQIYCYNLQYSIKEFNNKCKNIKLINYDRYSIENRTDKNIWQVFSIDPQNSLDLDDAFSIKQIEQNIMLSIYIVNVPIGIDNLDLWDYISNRVSTIYLPNKKYPVLPNILSDFLFSFIENNDRVAFTMDIFINNNNNIYDIKYSNTIINLYKNYYYEEKTLLLDNNYLLLFNICNKISDKPISDSHELVSYLMVLMNYNCSKELTKFKNGIFRTCTTNISTIPNKLYSFLINPNNYVSKYILYQNNMIHQGLQLESYIHITSPIRRIVDFLNIIQFQNNLNIINLSPKAYEFYNKWINKIEFINEKMKAIQKVQNRCKLLETNLDKYYDGYIYDIIKNDIINKYKVYLPELKLIVYDVNCNNEIENYSKHKFKLYIFNDEENIKKKIRVQIIL